MRDLDLIKRFNVLGYILLKDNKECYFNIEKNGKTQGPYNRDQLIKKLYELEEQYW